MAGSTAAAPLVLRRPLLEKRLDEAFGKRLTLVIAGAGYGKSTLVAGPASRRDISAWSMMHMPEIDRALERLEPLRRFRDQHGRELLDVPRAPLPDPETPAPVRFLPKWDNVLLAFADRTRVLPEEYRKTVIRMNGDVAQTFLVDGFVAGIWRVESGRVAIEPFALLSRSVQRELKDEAGRLEEFLAD